MSTNTRLAPDTRYPANHKLIGALVKGFSKFILFPLENGLYEVGTVSYTHLTLPTKLEV